VGPENDFGAARHVSESWFAGCDYENEIEIHFQHHERYRPEWAMARGKAANRVFSFPKWESALPMNH
jgi:hypothetical protein